MSAKRAILTSRLLSFNIEKCLVLRYKMDSRSKLVIHKNSSTSTPFRQTGNATGDFWGIATIPLYQGKSSKIVIEGIVDEKPDAYIAIDDIDIQDWKCNGRCSYHLLRGFCNFKPYHHARIRQTHRFLIFSINLMVAFINVRHDTIFGFSSHDQGFLQK